MPTDRSPFYLNEIITETAAECGWEVEFTWEQNATFPIIDREDMLGYVRYQVATMENLSKEDAIRVGDKILSIFEETISSKTPMIMNNRLMMFKRK